MYWIARKQGVNYLNKLKNNAKLCIAIEAACEFGWHEIIGSTGMFFGVNNFGESAPAQELYKHFSLTQSDISKEIIKRLVT